MVVSAIYRASDVLVLPSDYEPWALVINEAAAAGMAIVSSNVVGAAAELVRENVNGKLFAPGDLHGLINSLLEITDAGVTDRMKATSAQVLTDWRQRGDPVDGLRQALSLGNRSMIAE
jgi:glycosyltransferase involved in cell wall biosynthesis